MTARLVSIATLAFVVCASSAEAQRRTSPSIARVTPYAGYMQFGSYVDGPLGTSVRNAGAPVYGAQLGIDLLPNLAFVGNVAYSASNLEVGVPIIGGFDVGADTRVLMYDAGLQYRLPIGETLGRTSAVPFVEAGAGAMRTEVGVGSFDVRSTNLAWNFGGGVDLSLGRSLGVRAMAKDYVGKVDLKDVANLNISSKRTHNVAFTVGLNVGF
ncbi:MAG: outer membrane beta-barrel protein [Gemmatimonadaceae bacterium]|nr:outer membrane beta-barrel protein [Gemmatimonadaceae bacterium]